MTIRVGLIFQLLFVDLSQLARLRRCETAATYFDFTRTSLDRFSSEVMMSWRGFD
jgi:hypothetical protein